MNRIRNTNLRLVEVLVFYPKKNIKLQPVTPPMPLKALLISENLTDSDSDGIGGGTGCNFIYFFMDQLSPMRRIERLDENLSYVEEDCETPQRETLSPHSSKFLNDT